MYVIPVVGVSQASAVIPEALLVATTWRHAYITKLARDVQVDMPLTAILLRDGQCLTA